MASHEPHTSNSRSTRHVSRLSLKHNNSEDYPLTSTNDIATDLEDPLIKTEGPTDFTITSGWNWDLVLLLLNGITSICWGIALIIFTTGVVPIAYDISQLAKNYPETTNTVVALVAAVATMHITYILQKILEQHSHVAIVDGFSLGELKWMQGVMEMSITTKFPDRKSGGRLVFWSKKRMLWIVVYLGYAVHSSSIVAILQPEVFYKGVLFNDAIPCAQDLSSLTLDKEVGLTDDQQRIIDSFSFNVGTQLAVYGDEVNGNTTTAVGGRVYVKDDYAYGAIGGLENGLQEMPGVQFAAQCSEDDGKATEIWQLVFPDRTPPALTTLSNGSRIFNDTEVPSSIRNVVSHVEPLSLVPGASTMYALVTPSGSGALVGVQWLDDKPTSLTCSWKATPRLVNVQTIAFAARTLGSVDSDKYPSLSGRFTLKTLEGMAQSVRLGASLYATVRGPAGAIRDKLAGFEFKPNEFNTTSQVLQTLLADGGKAALTVYNTHWWIIFGTPGDHGPKCFSNNRTVAEHWRFGNKYHLGWPAVVWTTAMGIVAVVAAVWMQGKRRMQKVSVLGVTDAFLLGREDDIHERQILCVKDGKLVSR